MKKKIDDGSAGASHLRNHQVISSRIRSVARIWSVLVWGLALILLLGPRAGDALPVQGSSAIPLLLLVSLIGLGIAWKWEIWGAAINLGTYLAIEPLFYLQHGTWMNPGILIALSPVIMPGLLFALAWGMERGER